MFANLLLLAVVISSACVSSIDREKLISAAIQDVHSETETTTTQHQTVKGGPTTAGQLLQAFKHASKEAIEQGKARVKFEKMIHKAERNILNAEKREMDSKASNQEKAEEIAKVLMHKPGTVLTKEEVARIYQETKCHKEKVDCSQPQMRQIRTVTGVCNNLNKPFLGSADTPFRRLIPARYEDGFNQLRGTMQSQGSSLVSEGPFKPPNPSPRIISLSVIQDEPIINDNVTQMLMQWGQFMDHDLDLAPAFKEPPCTGCTITEQCVPIRVPTSDPTFGNPSQQMVCNPFPRSIPACDPEAAQGKVRPRQQLNELTSFIDASQVYGSSEKIFKAVRNGKTAFLRTGPNIPASGGASLPVDTIGLVECMGDQPCFLAGDVRVNEQISLTIMHTIWMREHNRIASSLLEMSPGADPEKVFQTARAIVGAELQKITLMDYLPVVLGWNNIQHLIGSYTGYKSDVNPSIPNAFATAAFRFGHSQINPFFNRLDENNQPLDPLPLVEAFFNSSQYAASGGTDPILRGLLTMPARKVDEFVNNVLTNHLFQTNASMPGMDLASLNIQRGRDHGLPPYLVWKRWAKEACGASSDFQNDLTTVRLLQTYGSLETVDLWVGGLSEKRMPGGLLGTTFSCIFAKTFQAIRDGDRFYFENPNFGFSEEQMETIRKNASLSRVICDNSDGINRIQENAFRAHQEPMNCSDLGKIDLSLWMNKDTFCYLRVRVNSQMGGIRLDSISRRRRERKQFEIVTSSREKTVCMPIIYPVNNSGWSGQVRASVFTRPQMCRVNPNHLLTNRSQSYFSARISSNDIENVKSGAYMDLQSCETGGAVAATFNCNSEVASVESDEKLLQDLESTLTQIAGSAKHQQADSVVEVPVDMPEDVRTFIDGDGEDDGKPDTKAQSNEPWKEKTISVLEGLLDALKVSKKDSEAQEDATDQELFENLAKLLKDTE